MLRYLVETRRWMAVLALVFWAVLSILSFFKGWGELFSAMGSLALSIGVAVFLADRFRAAEQRRMWDHQSETQNRMMWRFIQRVRHGDQGHEPHSLEEIETQITDSFETMMNAKYVEAKLETYRLETVFSIVGTLQWGFGGLLVESFR